MIRVAIVDDMENLRKQVRELLIQYAEINSCEFGITEFSSGEELLFSDQQFQLYLLDIEMGIFNGIETARSIRENDKSASIIYLTSHVKYAYQSFSTNPVTYLKKPVRIEEFNQAISKAINEYSFYEQSVEVNYNRVKNWIPLSTILYVERVNRGLNIVCRAPDIVRDSRSLQKFMHDHPFTEFVRASQGQIVNLRNVSGIHNHTVLFIESKKTVTISRRCQRSVEEKYCEYRLRKIKGEQ